MAFIDFSFNDGEPPVHPENGRLCVQANGQRCRISGYVLHYSNGNPVGNTEILLSAGQSDSVRSDEIGYYLFDRLLCTLHDTVCAAKVEYPSGGITAYDAALVLQSTVDVITLTPLQQMAGDVSGNCAVTAYDAALIGQRAAGLSASFPAGPWIVFPEKETITQENWCHVPSCLTHTPLAMDRDGQHFLAVPTGDVSGNWSPIPGMKETVSSFRAVEDKTVRPGEHVVLPFRVEDVKGLLSVDLTCTYDPDVMDFDSVSQAEITEDFMLMCNTCPGEITLSLFGHTPVNAHGVLFNYWFTVCGMRGEVSPFSVTKFLLNEKPVNVTGGHVRVGAWVPGRCALEQNAPNPFNPTTSIQYSVSSDQSSAHNVTLKIYNVLGQEVRTLVDGPKEAGTYVVRWDGKDTSGHEIPSGVYFYRLTSGRSTHSKKMVYLR